MRLIFSIGFLFFSQSFLLAQDVQMADAMRAEGKIYVVVAVLLVILFGLIIYLFSLDHKLSKIEKLKNE